MIRVTTIAVVVLAIVVGGAAALLLLAHSEPSTQTLDADLVNLRRQIAAADNEDSKYQGGAIKALISVRREILRISEAMLYQKRASILRRIDLGYNVGARRITPANSTSLADIVADLKKANAALSRDMSESARYSGGLVQTMSLITTATERVTIAQLELGYYTTKYGIGLPIGAPSARPATTQAPGKIVGDKNAF